MRVFPRFKVFLPCLLLPILAACAAQPLREDAPVAAVVKTEPDALQHASQYLAWLQTQSPEALLAESARLDATATAQAGMEKALLLARLQQPADIEAALLILDGITASTDAAAKPWQPVASLLAPLWRANYQEQKRLLEQAEKQSLLLRDSQRRVDQLNEKVEQLGHKLDALKSIELNLPKPAGNTAPSGLPNPASPAPASAPTATRSPAS